MSVKWGGGTLVRYENVSFCRDKIKKNLNVLKRKNMQRHFHNSFVRVTLVQKFALFLEILLKYFFFTTRYFLLQNHPFQAFLVSKTYIFISEEKNLHFCLKGLSSAKNISFLDGSPNEITKFSRIGGGKHFCSRKWMGF